MMRSRHLLPALIAGLGLTLLLSVPSPAEERASTDKIANLIEKMGSGTFAEREKATQALDAIGAPALEALKKAAKSEDAEVKRRAEELVKKIETRDASARLLAAKRVHLVYKDTPLPEAIADFQKKSGYSLYLHDPEGKLKERKITLDTGETTFWHAFDLFCAKAGLVEATMQDVMQPIQPPGPIAVPPVGAPVPLPKPLPIRKLPPQPARPRPGTLPAQPEPTPKRDPLSAQVAETRPAAGKPVAPPPPPVQVAAPAVQVQILPAGGGAAGPAIGRAPGGWGMMGMPGMQGQILLKAGKPRKLPTDDTSAVRVRALPKADVFGGPVPEGEIRLTLEVAPEPRLQWQYLQQVRIDKALDDQGQNLTQVMPMNPAVPGLPPGIGGFAPGVPVPAAAPMIRPAIWWGGGINQQVAVQFKKGEKASKSLKELKGVLTAQVLSDAKDTIVTDNLAKAVGQTAKGGEGGSIKVTDVKTDGGKTTIQFEFVQPQNVVPATPAANVIPPRGVPVIRPPVRILPAPAPPQAVPAAPPPAKAAQAIKQARQIQAQAGQAQAQVGRANAAIVIKGGPIAVGGGPVMTGPVNGLTIRDDKNKPLPFQIIQTQFRGQGAGGFVLAYTVVCQPQKDQGKPAKIVFAGRKSVSVEVPFTLKDVPLP